MKIREATEKDIPEILKVLKASLGEVSSKKTRSVWEFKHVRNPFGQSLVLIAEDNDNIIGVRAFMRWKWQRGDKIFSCFRAVDTATHPEHQGRGIFKKLTLEAIRLATEEGGHFAFNTPNDQSLPGYLKMGWKKVGKLKISLRPLNLIQIKKLEVQHEILGKKDDVLNLLNLFSSGLKPTNLLFTPKDLEFLTWRYLDNPLQKYSVIFHKDYFIAGYVKKRKRFDEFRVSEIIVSEQGKNHARKAVLKMARATNAKILSISPNVDVNLGLAMSGNFGPILTYRCFKESEAELSDLNNWAYSLGDLELF